MYDCASKDKQGIGDKMTSEETAKIYFEGKLSAYTIRDLWRRGELPGVKCGGRLIFSRVELDYWFRDRSRANVDRKEIQECGKLRIAGGTRNVGTASKGSIL